MKKVRLIVVAVLIAAPALAQPQFSQDKIGPDALKNANIVRWAKGDYEYRTLTSQIPRGSENFYLTVHRDGTRTMRAFTDIATRDVQANVVLRVASNFRPLDAYISQFTKGGYKGAMTIIVNGDTLRAITTGPAGQIDQTTAVPAQFSLLTHPLALDSWHPWYIAPNKDVEQAGAEYMINTEGDIGKPLTGQMQPETFIYRGEEDVTVPAGTFKATHVTMGKDSEIWFTGPDRILVRYAWASIDRDYVLKAIQTGP